MTRGPNLTTVARAYSPAETALATSMLEAAGIAVFPAHRYTMSLMLQYGQLLGGIEICVPTSDAEAAYAILADFQPYRRQSLAGRIGFLLLFLLANVPPPATGFSLVQPMDRRSVRIGTAV